MTHDLRERLQASLGNAYAIERELGGGGMSRTYVAIEAALRRRVVVKVLSPDLAVGVSVDRFQREIQLAAALQHPHVVPVLSAGDIGGLPYYTMPYVDGESLRARIARGPMSIGEIVPILRDVAKALAFAHQHGVVHRDIKPDNVLLAGGSATVADFGIAKAISAARTAGDAGHDGAALTQLGTALGTPAYMAPEQAAGDPSTDHRADLYAFGIMAYEMLAGRAPFTGLTPQRMLAAHMSERPVTIAQLRADVPPALAELVMRCVEKEADRRPQEAADIVRYLETITSGSGASTETAALRDSHVSLPRALALWAAGAVAAAVLAKAAIVGIGLPDWVFPATLVAMGLGLPAILATHWVHRTSRRALVTTPTLTPGGSAAAPGALATLALRASPHVSWRRTTLGGVAALVTLVLVTGGWMTLRALGIGPAGSLMASGKMSERERVILADFEGSSGDSILAPTVTEAFRTDLTESANLSIMPANAVREVLRRMQRPAATPVTFAVAREIATREGIKAVVSGTVTTIGGKYALSARLLSAQTGEELAAVRETADDEGDIIPSIGRLSRKLRSRVGESLRTIQNARALDQVTTPSLAALQKYVAANRAFRTEGDFAKGEALLLEAIALDSGFAMAYRRLGIELLNQGTAPVRMQQALSRAYEHRDRLSDVERYLATAAYFSYGPEQDKSKTIAAYEALLDLQPDNTTALNNLASEYYLRAEFAKAEELARRAVEVQPATTMTYYNNLMWSQVAQGKREEAVATAARAAKNLPQHPEVTQQLSTLAAWERKYDRALALEDSVLRARSGDLATVSASALRKGAYLLTTGRLAEGRRAYRVSNDASARLGASGMALASQLDEADHQAWFLDRRDDAARTLERALAETPLESLSPLDRPYERLVFVWSLAGRVDRAKAVLADFDRARDTLAFPDEEPMRGMMAGHIAVAEARWEDAVREYRATEASRCHGCALPLLARAYDLSGNADSAGAVLARYVSSPTTIFRIQYSENFALAGTHKRLGELYDAKGDGAKAASHYAQFVELWKDADPELQPQVTAARNRLRELQRAERP
jgi:tetratricopeptide (TPR) repeat protein/tRNA A-37 threonylcarbamoyl transferase component Bud32